jgi:lipoate-protein ligase A
MPVVRRQTGGGAILHHDELTYSLVLPLAEKDEATDIAGMYKLVHDAYMAALGKLGLDVDYRGGQDEGNAQRGPFFCFARMHRLDLVAGGAKLVGSAQRRAKHAVLQHGSLILQRHFEQQPSAEVVAGAEKAIDVRAFVAEVAGRIGEQLGLRVAVGRLSEGELRREAELQEKYAGEAWNRQR